MLCISLIKTQNTCHKNEIDVFYDKYSHIPVLLLLINATWHNRCFLRQIQSAQIVSAQGETAEYLASAKKILEEVVQKQTEDVDTVSGATLSSNGILEAVRQAMEAKEKTQLPLGRETGKKIFHGLPFQSISR